MGSLGPSGTPGQVVLTPEKPAEAPEKSENPALPRMPARRHNRADPKLFPKWRNHHAPKLAREAVALLVEQYEQRGKKGDRLHSLLKRHAGRGQSRRFFSVTRKRSDRTEAQIRVMIFELEHADYGDESGMWIGIFDKKAQRIGRGFTLEEMARATELARPSQRYADNPTKVRSDCTLDRVISNLHSAEYVHTHQPIEREQLEGGLVEYSGKVAQRKLTLKFFVELGIPEERVKVLLREARERRHQKVKAVERERPAPAVGTLISEMIDPAVNDLRSELAKVSEGVDGPQLRSLLWTVHAEHRDWAAADVEREALRRLQRTKPPPDRR